MAINPELKYLKFWLAIGYCLIVLVVYLSLTGKPIKVDVKNFDKWGHLLAYFTLMFWFAMIYHVNRQRYLWAVFFIALGVSMEFLQSLTPERYFEYADMLANTVGVLIGFIVSMTGLKNILVRLEKII